MSNSKMLIRLIECEIMIEIGIHDFEQGVKQRVLVDVEVETNLISTEDHISSTLDYDLIHNFIKDCGERKFALQETLAQKILNFVTAMPLVEYTRVYVRKTDVYPDTKEVGIQLTWNKPLLPPVMNGS